MSVEDRILLTEVPNSRWGSFITLLVCTVRVPGKSRGRSELDPDLWVQKKHIQFWQSAQYSTLCSAEFLGQLFSYSSFDFLWDLCDIVFIDSRNICVPRQVVPRMFLLTFSIDWNFTPRNKVCCLLISSLTFSVGIRGGGGGNAPSLGTTRRLRWWFAKISAADTRKVSLPSKALKN